MMPQTMSQQRTSAAAAPMNTFGMPQSTAPMIPPQQQQQQPTGPVSCSFDTGHTGSIHDAQLDYYGKRLATASGDSTVRVWDVSTEQQALLGELRGHSSPVWQVSWAHPKYGSVLASVGYDRQIIIWRERVAGGYHQHQQTTTWEQLYCDKSHTASVNTCAFAPWEYGLVLAAGSSDGSISVLTHEQMSTWSRKAIPRAHLGGVLALSWSPATTPSTLASGPAVQQQPSNEEQAGPRRIVSGGNDNQVRIWRMDEATGEWSMETELSSGRHTDVVRDVAWRPNAGIPTQHIASCSEDGSVVIWQCDMEGQGWKVAQEFHMKSAAYRLSWSITGTVLAVALADNTVELIKENFDGQFVHLSGVDEQGVPEDSNGSAGNGMIGAYGPDAHQDPHNVAAAILGSA